MTSEKKSNLSTKKSTELVRFARFYYVSLWSCGCRFNYSKTILDLRSGNTSDRLQVKPLLYIKFVMDVHWRQWPLTTRAAYAFATPFSTNKKKSIGTSTVFGFQGHFTKSYATIDRSVIAVVFPVGQSCRLSYNYGHSNIEVRNQTCVGPPTYFFVSALAMYNGIIIQSWLRFK